MIYNLPYKIIEYIYEYLNFVDIMNLNNVFVKLRNFNNIYFINNPKYICSYITILLNSRIKTNKIRELILKNIKNLDNDYEKWYSIFKIRINTLLNLNKNKNNILCSKNFKLIHNPQIRSKIMRHPECDIITSPNLFIETIIESKLESELNLLNINNDCKLKFRMSYHDTGYLSCISKYSIIFSSEITVSIKNKQLNVYSYNRIWDGDKDFKNVDNTFSINIMSNPPRNFLHFNRKDISLKYYFDNKYSKEENVSCKFPKYNSLNNYIIDIATTILAKIYTIKNDKGIDFGSILTDKMGHLMGTKSKEDTMHELLFGNMRELYIPQGDLVSF